MQINSLINNLSVQNRTSSVMPYNKMDQASFLDYMKQATETGSNAELTGIAELSKAYSVGKADAACFADAFTRYDVTTHVGNANISDAHWQRNDFPIWKYFEKGASADCLNNWEPSDPIRRKQIRMFSGDWHRLARGKCLSLFLTHCKKRWTLIRSMLKK